MADSNEATTGRAQMAPDTPATLLAAADAAEAAARDMRREAAQLALAAEEARRPRMPAIGGEGDRAIVSFTKYQSGREYNYAAIGWRQGRSVRWAITGETTDRFNWPGLLRWVGEANWPSLQLMVESESLAPDSEPAVRERMGSFGRVLATTGVVEPLVRAEVPRGGVIGPFAAGGLLGGYASDGYDGQ